MPRLPAPEDYALSTPSPSRALTSVTPVQERPDLATGKAMEEVGSSLQELALKKTAEYDDFAAQTALNKLQEKKLQLAMGDNGYTKLQGDQVLQKDVLGDYSGQLQREADSLAQGINSQAAKAKFQLGAQHTLLQLRTGLMTHMVTEGEKALDAGATATFKSAAEAAALQANDPKAVADAEARAQAEFEKTAARKGYTGDQLVQYRRETVGAVHAAVVAGMLQTDTAAAAANAGAYLAAHKDEMTTEKVLHFGGLIRTATLKHDALANADIVAAALAPKTPSEIDRAVDLAGPVDLSKVDFAKADQAMMKVESGGRQFGPDGKILQGPMTRFGTAKGDRQVLDSTNAQPGYGVRPAQNDSPEERSRVGREYMAAMITKYNGDLEKAAAAYNMGPGALDKLLENNRGHGQVPATDWRKGLPKETADYIGKFMTAYNAGETGRPQATLQEAKEVLKARMKDRPPEAVDMAIARLTTSWSDAKAAQAQREEETLLDLRRRIDDGRVVDISQVSPAEKTLLGDKAHVVKSYIESEGRKADKNLELSVAGTALYFALKEDPVRLKNSSIADIMRLAPEIGQKRMQALEAERDRLIKLPEHEKSAQLDSDQFKEIANRSGINTKTDEGKKEFVHLKDRSEELIIAEQQRLNRSLSREEKKQIIVGAMTKVPVNASTWYGAPSGGSMEKRGADVSFKENILIPQDFKLSIAAQAKKAGVDMPDDNQLRVMYVASLAKKQGLR